jgi:hypothetical protein
MPRHHVVSGQGLAKMSGEQHVDPGMDLQPSRPRPIDEAREGIEVGGLSTQERASRNDP